MCLRSESRDDKNTKLLTGTKLIRGDKMADFEVDVKDEKLSSTHFPH